MGSNKNPNDRTHHQSTSFRLLLSFLLGLYIGKNCPELSAKFFAWYNAVFEDGALSAREKSLIALAVAHTVQCPYCIEAYTADALEKGADIDQMTETVHVASAIRGGASLVHGIQMRNKATQVGM